MMPAVAQLLSLIAVQREEPPSPAQALLASSRASFWPFCRSSRTSRRSARTGAGPGGSPGKSRSHSGYSCTGARATRSRRAPFRRRQYPASNAPNDIERQNVLLNVLLETGEHFRASPVAAAPIHRREGNVLAFWPCVAAEAVLVGGVLEKGFFGYC